MKAFLLPWLISSLIFFLSNAVTFLTYIFLCTENLLLTFLARQIYWWQVPSIFGWKSIHWIQSSRMESFFSFPHKCLIPLSSYIISKKVSATLILAPLAKVLFLWFLKIFSLCIWFSEVCIWYPRCRCFGIYLSRFLWVSWICGLTYNINLEKFSVIIASDTSYISFFSVQVFPVNLCNTFCNCPIVLGYFVLGLFFPQYFWF